MGESGIVSSFAPACRLRLRSSSYGGRSCGLRSLLTPVAAPIAFLPIGKVAAPSFGRLAPGDAGYDAYRGALRRITDEPFALFISPLR
jgi:hypothetical protein